MPITVVTGQPGNGKTLYAMEMLEAALKEAKRPIYCHGVEGSLPAQARPLPDPREWEKCEDGSLIFVDEAWEEFGHLQDARGAPTPPHVLALATHRHRGFDFVMTTQQTNQLYPFMRGLVGEHIHVSRKFGTGICTVYKWGELCEDVKSQTQRDKALSSTWAHPARLFDQFKTGAGIHTIKRKIPWRVALIPICVIAAIVLAWNVYARMKAGQLTNAQAEASSGVAADAGRPGAAAERKAPMTAAEWAAQLTPRIVGVHGSEPIFDARKAKSEPATYCVIGGHSEDATSRCRCFTEQATIIEGVAPMVCRQWARMGRYDPFRTMATGQRSSTARTVAAVEPDRVDLGGVSAGEPYSIGTPDLGKVQGQ